MSNENFSQLPPRQRVIRAKCVEIWLAVHKTSPYQAREVAALHESEGNTLAWLKLFETSAGIVEVEMLLLEVK